MLRKPSKEFTPYVGSEFNPRWCTHRGQRRNSRIRGFKGKEGLPGRLSDKESGCQCSRHRFSPWVGKIPWKRKWQSTPVFLSGKFHGQTENSMDCVAGYSPRGHKKLDTTEMHPKGKKDAQRKQFRITWSATLPSESFLPVLTSRWL